MPSEPRPAPIPLHDGAEMRPVRESDAPAMYACAKRNLDRLRPWFFWANDEMSVLSFAQYLREIERQDEPRRDYEYALRVNGAVAGSIGLHVVDWRNSIARIGYWLDSAVQGRGLVTAGAYVLIERAFFDLGINRIEIRCAPENAPSRAVPRRLGFREEGTHRQVLAIHGGFQDLVTYAMLANEWNAPRTSR